MGPNPRDEIKDALKYGRLKPEEAEARLQELGLPPLASQPDPTAFNPMGETWWTLPMTLAWIAWRSPREVLEAWDSYRAECWDWHFREWRDGPVGPVHAGFFSAQREPATMTWLFLREGYDRAHSKLPKGFISVAEARANLWKALGDASLQATGIDRRRGERVAIQADHWRDLEITEEHNRVILLARRANRVSGPGFDDVVLLRQRVVALWPSNPSKESPPETHSGGAGRPSAMHLVEAEYERRTALGELNGRIGQVSEILAEWAHETYPDLRTPGPGTIANVLRARHRKALTSTK